jgi:cytochrome c-type biogenesis protein CcmH
VNRSLVPLAAVMMTLVFVLGAMVLSMLSTGVAAAEAQPVAADPVIEARLQHITGDLRCLVCQNETLAASRSGLADDLRREIRVLLHEGKSDREVLDFLVDRYGDFVSYRPPFKATTWLLWLAPFLMLLAGLGLLYRILKSPPGGEHVEELTS